jgi:CubicO group peptidase (beta-lactamase class C family)
MGQRVFSEVYYEGIGFGLGVSVTLDPAKAGAMGSVGDHGWGGAASTAFWVDRAEDLVVVQLAQLMPSSTHPIRRELRTLVYQSLVD